jgi:hypothetical protein
LGAHDGSVAAARDSHISDVIQPLIKPGEPCPGAQQYALSELVNVADVPVWMPNSDAASRSNLTGAWTCQNSSQPLLAFASGVNVTYEPGWAGVDASKQWQTLIDFYHIGRVETVLGRPALVYDVGKSAPDGQVMVLDDDTLIRVVGNGSVTTSQLVDVANSIDLANPISPK